jgi:hypothetical protein
VAAASESTPASSVHLDPDILSGFLKKHCTDCHGPKKQKGETRLDTLSLEIANSDTALHWQEVLDVLNLGEMPPEDEPQPAAEELKAVLAHLTDALTESKLRLSESGGNVALRRINRREYRNTMDQLFGFRVPDELLPPDDIAEGYDTVGQDQQFSSYHFDNYFDAAKSIVKVALKYADAPRTEPKMQRFEPESRNGGIAKYVKDYDKKMARINAGGTYKDIGLDDEKQLQLFIKRYDERAGGRKRYLERPFTDKGVFIQESGYYRATGMPNLTFDPRARYTFRVVAGLNGEVPTLRQFLKVSVNDRQIGCLKVEGSLEGPGTYEMIYRPFLSDNRVGFKVEENKGAANIKNYLRALHGKNPKESIWIDRVEHDGPFYNDPSFFETAYLATFGKPQRRRGKPSGEQRAKQDALAKGFLQAFMAKTLRGRKAAPDFSDRVLAIYALHRERGRSVKESLEAPLAMILSSPSFLYVMEDGATEESRTVSELEFAHRMSLFLWSRPADTQLQQAAETGELSDQDVLREHIERMLKHRNSWALSEGFFSQWVDLERFDSIAIDETEHIHFNDGIRSAAREEVQRFFDTMVKENLSLTHLIDSDFIMANDLLAFHYGLKIPSIGSEFKKVSLPDGSPRGGLLGTTAFLTMGTNGERSSPIIRGALVMEKFLHRKPADPPPNVPELALASDKPLAVKETIKLHREKTQCASCHSSFDPLGFGLENFDLLGQWRDHEILGNIGKKGKSGRKKKIPVRAEGVFPDGDAFADLDEFRAGLMQRKDLLTRSIAEGLLSYGMGRHIEFADQQAIDEICAAAKESDARIGDLIVSIVTHPVFRRGDRFDGDSSAAIDK